MNFYIAANKNTRTILDMGINSLELASATPRTSFIEALSVNYGIAENEIVLYVHGNLEEGQDILEGAAYTLIWDGDEISGIDFTAETLKPIVKAYASETSILANGVDSTTITIEVWKADGSGIASNYNNTAIVPVVTPSGTIKLRAQFVSGVASRVFKTTRPGTWIIPAPLKRYEGVRISSYAQIDSIQSFSDM